MKHHKGFIAISGPTGSGKNVVVQELLEAFPILEEVVTMTTRPKRKKDRDGRDYYFVSEKQFTRYIAKGYFLEWAMVHGNYYGTPKRGVEKIWRQQRIPILDIDVQGGLAIKRKNRHAFLLFIRPTPWKKYAIRLQHDRGHEPNFRTRLESIKFELSMARQYDTVVYNREGALPETIRTVKDRIERYVRHLGIYSG